MAIGILNALAVDPTPIVQTYAIQVRLSCGFLHALFQLYRVGSYGCLNTSHSGYPLEYARPIRATSRT